MIYLIGIGLIPEQITYAGLQACKKSKEIYLETYTSKFPENTITDLEELIGKKIIPIGRDEMENKAEEFLEQGKDEDIAILFIGDVLTATTHIDFILRAKSHNVKIKVFPGVSIYTVAPGLSGLQAYKFGRATTIAYHEEGFEPESFYDVIKENLERGLHTLVLLDIKSDKEKYMSGKEGLELLQKIAEKRNENINDWNAIILAGLGSSEQKIIYGTIKKLVEKEIEIRPQTLIITGNLHKMEIEALKAMQNE